MNQEPFSADAVGTAVIIGCCNLITDAPRQYLLVREAKRSARGRYNLPAGKPEVGETLTQAARREAAEETGLEVVVDFLVGVYHCPRTSEGFGVVNFVFSSRAVGGALTESDPHPEVRFFAPEDIARLAAQRLIRGTHIERAIRDHQAGTSIPLELIQLCEPSPQS